MAVGSVVEPRTISYSSTMVPRQGAIAINMFALSTCVLVFNVVYGLINIIVLEYTSKWYLGECWSQVLCPLKLPIIVVDVGARPKVCEFLPATLTKRISIEVNDLYRQASLPKYEAIRAFGKRVCTQVHVFGFYMR